MNLITLCSHISQRLVLVVVSSHDKSDQVVDASSNSKQKKYSFSRNVDRHHMCRFDMVDHNISLAQSPSVQIVDTNSVQSSHSISSFKEPDFLVRLNYSTYDICPSVEKTSLLSDGWGDIFVGGVRVVFSGGAD